MLLQSALKASIIFLVLVPIVFRFALHLRYEIWFYVICFATMIVVDLIISAVSNAIKQHYKVDSKQKKV